MSVKKTVFVLGAGASYEFNLPVGDMLKLTIAKLFNFKFDFGNLRSGDEIIAQALHVHASQKGTRDINPAIRAAREVANALPLALSIDNYLHIHNEDEYVKLVGKLAIVRAILSAESKSSLVMKQEATDMDFGKLNGTWLIRLVQILTEQCSLEGLKDRLSALTFVIFNYDRCLEHFLVNAFATVYRIPIEHAAELVGCISIFHPYGIVGNLPWMKNVEGEFIEYGGTPRGENLLKLSSEIKTFTEGMDDARSDFTDIRTAVQAADRFVFLGYAYHPLNMRVLLGDSPKSKLTRRVFATAYGMSDSDTKMVRDSLDNSLNAPSAAVRNDLTCYKLFHEYSKTLGFN